MKSRPLHFTSDPVLSALQAAAAAHSLFARQAPGYLPVVVAVSGGADSVCLLHAIRQLADTWQLELHIAHVDHGLRLTASRDREFVAALAALYCLPFHSRQLDPDTLRASSCGQEAAARAARYEFLAAVARNVTGAAVHTGAPALQPCVAVAHHAGDQAETVLLHLIQGAGLQGLGGLRPVGGVPTPTGGQPPVRLVRPLLAVPRSEILAYLQRHGLQWVEDETNADTRHARNYLRHVVLPALSELNPNIVATLTRTAEVLAAETRRAEAVDAAALLALCSEPPAAERVVLDLVRWQQLEPAAQRGVLRLALARLGADGREVGYEHLLQIERAAQRIAGSGPHPLPGGLAWSIVGAGGWTGQWTGPLAEPGPPARLCLHTAAAPPLAIDHPFLDGAWRAAHAACPLPIPGEIAAGSWRLAATRLPAAEVPGDWRTRAAPWRLYADAAAVGEPLLAAPYPGLRIAPFGMGGAHRLVADVLAGHKVPPVVRRGWPLLVDRRDGRVLWVCGLRTAESLRITPQTREVVCMEWQRG